MNARQKAKMYKKIAEANRKDAEAWRRHMKAESFKKQTEKKININPYSTSYLIPINEIMQLGEEAVESHARFILANHFRDFVEDKLKIEKINRGCGIEHKTTMYIGIEG